MRSCIALRVFEASIGIAFSQPSFCFFATRSLVSLPDLHFIPSTQTETLSSSTREKHILQSTRAHIHLIQEKTPSNLQSRWAVPHRGSKFDCTFSAAPLTADSTNTKPGIPEPIPHPTSIPQNHHPQFTHTTEPPLTVPCIFQKHHQESL